MGFCLVLYFKTDYISFKRQQFIILKKKKVDFCILKSVVGGFAGTKTNILKKKNLL
jgi:hypothetical protein